MAAQAQVSLTTLDTAYTQNFDTLPASSSATWINNSTIPGWFHARTGTGTTVVANDGSSNGGNLYSYGTGTNTDRALGSLGSGNAAVGNLFWGVRLQNNTGSTITSLDVSYVGEQWRNSAAAAQTVTFSYLIGSPTVTGSLAEFQSAGTAVSALDFTGPISGGTAGALNGNLAANRTTLTHTITGLSIPNGSEFMLRWSDPDHTGADHGLAIDDFSVTPHSGAGTPTLSINDVSLNEGNAGTTTFTFTVSLSAPAPAGGVTFDIATADGTATSGSGDYVARSLTGQTIPADSSSYSFDVTVNGDATVEPNETFFVNVTNITGAIAGETQGQGTIVDDDAPPTVSINNVSLPEGNSSATTFNFTVTLSATPSADVTVQYATADGTATYADDDFLSQNGQIFFAAGTTTLTQTIPVLVIGDTKVEPDETFSIVFSSPVNATITPGGGIGTILNDDVALTPIHDIQGNGAASPIAGISVTTRGIVTGVKSNGFFMQAADADVDADPNTSEGIFVFTSSAPPAAVAIGNLVQVTASVQEYIPSTDVNSPPLTELTSPTVSLVSTGNALPTPITLTTFDMIGDINNLEKYEGMRVRVASLTAISGTQGSVSEVNATSTSNGVFYGVLTGTPRPFREAGVQVPDPLPAGSPCCIPRFDANPERLRVDSDVLGAPAIDVSTGAVLTNVVGPLDYAFRTYTIDIDTAAVTPAPTVVPGMSVTPATAPLAGEITIASFNLERFFDTVDDPGISDVVLTTAAFNKRLTKASLAIRNFLNTPDIIGVEEMENLGALQALSAKISSDAIAASQPDPQYLACLVEGNDVGGIDVGFLVKAAAATATTHHVEMITCTQYNKNSTYTNPDNSTALLNDRPPLELVATVSNAAGDSFPVTVYVNHLRSLNGQDDPVDGARVRAKRQAQAVELANLIQSRQTNFPGDHIVVLGDFNAFDVNDGYGDSMGTISGTPAPDNETIVTGDGTSPVNPALTNLSNTPPPAERYSYTFDGNAQSIDHILINSTLTGVTHRLEHARIDADFPDVLRGDASTPSRISDHDPALLYLDALPTSKVSVTQTAMPDPVAAGAQITYTIIVTNAGQGTAGNVSLSDALPADTTFTSLTSPGGWSCTLPASGTNGTVTCTIASLAAGSSATFTLVVTVTAGTVDGTSIANTATAAVATNDDGSGPLSALATVTVQTPVNGACGADNGQILLAAPTNLCSAGTATVVSGSGHPWSWSCNGTNDGTNATCAATIRTWTVTTTGSGGGATISAPAQSTVDHGGATTFTVTVSNPDIITTVTGDTCTPSQQSGNTYTTGVITADCTILLGIVISDPIGVCGSDNGQTLAAPPTNLCLSGTPGPVVGNGPWTWSCMGLTTANCSANATTGSINVLGGGTPIANGDGSPSAADGTDFGNVTVGMQAARGFTINNPAPPQAPAGSATKLASAAFALPDATGDLVVSSITSSNPAFTIVGGTGTLPRGGTATFTVTFNATTAGAQSATISVASNDASTPTFTFAVTANAVAAPAPGNAVAAPVLDARSLLLLVAALAALGGLALRNRSMR